MVISLGWLSPATSRGLPAAPTTRAGSRCLLGLAPTGGYRAAPVARRAVGSYPTFSPLPLDKGRSVFCGPFRRLTAPRGYLAVCPMELGLSSARHSDRRTATITPYRQPGGKVPVLEGSRQASARQPPHQPDQTVARQSRAGGPRAPPPTTSAPPPPPPPSRVPLRGTRSRRCPRRRLVLALPSPGRAAARARAQRRARRSAPVPGATPAGRAFWLQA